MKGSTGLSRWIGDDGHFITHSVADQQVIRVIRIVNIKCILIYILLTLMSFASVHAEENINKKSFHLLPMSTMAGFVVNVTMVRMYHSDH